MLFGTTGLSKFKEAFPSTRCYILPNNSQSASIICIFAINQFGINGENLIHHRIPKERPLPAFEFTEKTRIRFIYQAFLMTE